MIKILGPEGRLALRALLKEPLVSAAVVLILGPQPGRARSSLQP